MKTHLLVLFFVVFAFKSLIAQDLSKPQNIQSPNAASLGIYGDVSLSYYTGSPNIGIPLYSLNNNDIPLEISLSYNSSGVRVNDLPGWTGQNWSLNAGGVITRKVNGLEDEVDTSIYPDYHFNNWLSYGYFHSAARGQLNVDQWDDEDYILGNISTGSYQNQTQIDLEPDVFTFNFMGHSGKFFMGADGKFKVLSKSNLKIIIDTEDIEFPLGECMVPFGEGLGGGGSVLGCSTGIGFHTLKLLYKISIIDDKGNTYIFGNTDNSIEYDNNLFQHYNTYWTANAWYLTKVLDKYGNTVYEFEYERDSKFATSFYRLIRTEANSIKEKNGGFTATNCSGSSGWSSAHMNSGGYISTLGNTYRHPYKGRLISQVYLNKIKTDLGDIVLNSSRAWAKHYLDYAGLVYDIKDNDYRDYHQNGVGAHAQYYLLPEVVFGTDNDLINKFSKGRALRSISGLSKSITLSYNEDYISGVKKRLNLLSIQVDGKEYSFDYNDIEGLPDFLSTRTDHWGYFNGATPISLTGTVGSYFASQDNGAAYFASREAHPDNVKKGMLVKIIYPTGGSTEFEWEANRYHRIVSDDKASLINVNPSNSYAGGVRVSKITNKFSEADEVVREFEYSDGILESKPRYYWSNFKQEDDDFTVNTTLFSTTPAIPLSNYSGYHIGYSEVTEKFSDGSKIKYNYTSNSNPDYRDEYHFFSNDSDPNPNSQYSDKSLLRGHLKEKVVYNSNNTIKQTIIKNYEYDESKYSRAVIRLSYFCSGHGAGVSLGYGYKLFYFDNNVNQEETIDYLDFGFVKQKSIYEWASSITNNTIEDVGDTFLESKTTNVYNPGGNISPKEIIENYDYPFDFSNQIYQDMKDKRMLDLVRTNTYVNTVKTNEKRVTYSSNANNIYPEIYWTANKGNNLKEELIYHSTDFKGQPRETSRPDGIHTIYVYGYNDSYLIAKIENATYTGLTQGQSYYISESKGASNYDLASSSVFSENLLRDKLGVLRSYFPNALVTTYTYDPLIGVTSITDPRGYTVYYEYDGFNRLKQVKDADGNILSENEYNYKQ